MLAYSAIQISEIRAIFPPDQRGVFSRVPVTILSDVIPIVTGVAEIAYIGLGWKIYTEFGWQLYKLLGADRRIKKMYAQYQIFESMLKFDVFFWLGFSIQVRLSESTFLWEIFIYNCKFIVYWSGAEPRRL